MKFVDDDDDDDDFTRMDLLQDYDSLCDPRGRASPPGEVSSGKISGKKIFEHNY